MQLSFGNMTIDLNVFNVAKELQDDEEVFQVDRIEANVDDNLVVSNYCDDLLEKSSTYFGLSFDSDSAKNNLAPIMDTTKWKARLEPLSPKKNIDANHKIACNISILQKMKNHSSSYKHMDFTERDDF